jgi:plastocyanin
VRSRWAAAAPLALACLLALAAATPAAAANRRVAIGDYTWSDKEIHIDLGEHVTWHWVGPDTMHSVTGISDNDRDIDSDPGVNQPNHPLGDTFAVDFDQPGTYLFRCKLHSAVGGEIVVSSDPGDPVSEPDPVPPVRVDRTPPTLSDVLLSKPVFHRRGTSLRYSLDESARVEADIYRLGDPAGRVFAGWTKWHGHIGYNQTRFGRRAAHFRPKRGHYVALLRAYDDAGNQTRAQRLSFEIRRTRSRG